MSLFITTILLGVLGLALGTGVIVLSIKLWKSTAAQSRSEQSAIIAEDKTAQLLSLQKVLDEANSKVETIRGEKERLARDLAATNEALKHKSEALISSSAVLETLRHEHSELQKADAALGEAF